MARNPDSLAVYTIIESYVKMIATKCSQTYSKKKETIKKIECGDAIPTGSSSTTKVMCLICTYDDGTVINIDATPIATAVSDVVSKSDLANALKDYLKIANAFNPDNKDTLKLFTQDESGKLLFNGKAIESSSSIILDNELSDTSENGVKNKVITDALKKYLKITDAYNPSNKDTLNRLTQDESGNLLYNGKGIISSSGGSTTEWSDVSNKPFATLDGTSFTVTDGKLKLTNIVTLDDTLSDTSENGVKNKVVANEFKNYTRTTDLNTTLSNYVKTTDLTTKLLDYVKTTTLETKLSDYVTTTKLTTKLSDYTKTTDLEANYAKKSELHSHNNKTVLDKLSDDSGSLKYGTNILLTQAVVDGLISETKADSKYVAKNRVESTALDLTTL